MAVPSVLSTKPVRVFVIVSSTLCLFVFWSAILSSMWTFESELVKDGGESAEPSDQVCHVLVISTYPPRRLVVKPIFLKKFVLFRRACLAFSWFVTPRLTRSGIFCKGLVTRPYLCRFPWWFSR